MGLDIRIPIGAMFGILGVIITVYGLVSDKQIYVKHSLGININLWWGIVLILFAACMLALAARASRKHREEGPARPAPGDPRPGKRH
jgi:drug/metabolite transporter (DMT)-like permease